MIAKTSHQPKKFIKRLLRNSGKKRTRAKFQLNVTIAKKFCLGWDFVNFFFQFSQIFSHDKKKMSNFEKLHSIAK